ncbi:DEAD/DEAH box helicase, partial [Paenibacillus sp. TAF58]
MKTFQEFGLEPTILRAITEMGFEESTPIQEKTIPLAMEGRDLIGQAQTGTGKTAAFGIPLIHKIS